MDERFKTAFAEIEAIYAKHKLNGVVLLTDVEKKESGEGCIVDYMPVFDSNTTCIKVIEGGLCIRIKKSGEKNEFYRRMAGTYSLLRGLAQALSSLHKQFDTASNHFVEAVSEMNEEMAKQVSELNHKK